MLVADRSQLRLKCYLIPCEMWPFWILPNIYRSHILNLIMTRFHPLFASYFDANNRFIHVILAFYQQKLKTNLTNYPIFHKQIRLKNIWENSHILFYIILFSPRLRKRLFMDIFLYYFVYLTDIIKRDVDETEWLIIRSRSCYILYRKVATPNSYCSNMLVTIVYKCM